MIICHCKAISDREVRRLQLEEGARCARDVAKRCQAGTVCGGCLPALRETLAQNGSALVRSAARHDGPPAVA